MLRRTCANAQSRQNVRYLHKYFMELWKSSDKYWPRHEKIRLRGFANNKGAAQPAHPRSLISAFVITHWNG